ncbi:uncharacterized protein LOC141643434 [Silene latifolia]|uniref:uncharacterized protein LOC141643434 n=1 Tax=Silene latifolia TaxID=37657 RepID=UPI003D77E8CE
MPLLEVIGVTPVGKNFSMFFALLQNEKKTAYNWALKCMREVIGSDENTVFLTDCEEALINAIKNNFPNAKRLLYRRHIEKDVEAWVKKTRIKNSGSVGETFAKGRWTRMVSSTSEKQFLENEKEMYKAYKFVPGLKKYCKNTWINKYKENFVSAWTDKVLHFGNITTNRVEGTHPALKRLLRTSVGGLDTVFETIHHAVNLQYHEIKDEFARSQTIRLHLTQAMSVYQRLTHNVTHNAIRILDDALKEMRKISEFAEILLHPPNVVDPEVKKTKGRPKKTYVSRNPSHWEYVDKMFPKTSRKKVKTTATIDTPTSSTTPVNTPITSTAPVNTPTTSMSFSQDDKSCTPFPYPNAIADYFSRYTTDCVNVKGDGHCGYRAIAHEIYENENEWAKFRHDLLDALNVNRQYYVDVCLRNDSPLPSLYPSCRGIEHDSSQVANRITLYESMQPPRQTASFPITLSDL